jgi:hypothetical protein
MKIQVFKFEDFSIMKFKFLEKIQAAAFPQ